MSQTKANPFKPVVVAYFVCDVCKEHMDAAVVMEANAVKRIQKTYHEACFDAKIAPTIQMIRQGEN